MTLWKARILYSKASLSYCNDLNCFVMQRRDIYYTLFFVLTPPEAMYNLNPHLFIPPNDGSYRTVHKAKHKLLEKLHLPWFSVLFSCSLSSAPFPEEDISRTADNPQRRKAFLPSSSWADGICILTYCKSSHPGNGLQLATAQWRSAWFLLKLEVRPIWFLTVQGRMPSYMANSILRVNFHLGDWALANKGKLGHFNMIITKVLTG